MNFMGSLLLGMQLVAPARRFRHLCLSERRRSGLRRSSHTLRQSIQRHQIVILPGDESVRETLVPLPELVPAMLKTFSLSLLFMLTIGLLIAAYASIPT